MYITASKLYDYLQCPHKVWRDIYGPQDEKIKETNPFVELLWKKGLQHEDKVVSGIGEFVDISEGSIDERFEATLNAMQEGNPMIFQGVLKQGNLLGIPDLLKKLPNGEYIPIDIKSGMGFEGGDENSRDEGKPKKHYAVQLCLYNELLKKLGFCTHNLGRIIDINKNEVEYYLDSPMGVRNKQTWCEFYEKVKKHVEFLMKNLDKNKPAMAGICKLCPWYKSCKKWCSENKDLSTIYFLGRSIRDRINEDLFIENVDELIELDISEAIQTKDREKKDGNKGFLFNISDKTLEKFKNRAEILYRSKRPKIYEPILFPQVDYELFFDIEDDPTQEFVYMHGIFERKGRDTRYLDFTAKELNPDEEKRVWENFWEYIFGLPQDNFAIYYYSPHEKTTYKKLQKKYPDVISLDHIETFFDNDNAIDLYTGIVNKNTDWPLGSYSLKDIATYLGFKWRDETPSGALSIQWFNEYLDTRDEKILERILLYNEDDCKATMVLKDALYSLSN